MKKNQHQYNFNPMSEYDAFARLAMPLFKKFRKVNTNTQPEIIKVKEYKKHTKLNSWSSKEIRQFKKEYKEELQKQYEDNMRQNIENFNHRLAQSGYDYSGMEIH